ncbi:MAG: hypothetical protein LCH67_06190 [Bacteroidetes bacterium]|nr:hypothetical protein [Bacteroidota bacterium]
MNYEQIKQKYAPDVKQHRAKVGIFDAKIEAKELLIKEWVDYRESQRGIITAEATQNFFNAQTTIGKLERELEALKLEKSQSLLTEADIKQVTQIIGFGF